MYPAIFISRFLCVRSTQNLNWSKLYLCYTHFFWCVTLFEILFQLHFLMFSTTQLLKQLSSSGKFSFRNPLHHELPYRHTRVLLLYHSTPLYFILHDLNFNLLISRLLFTVVSKIVFVLCLSTVSPSHCNFSLSYPSSHSLQESIILFLRRIRKEKISLGKRSLPL